MTAKDSIVIEGGVPLVGEIKLSGSKTLALKLIYASLLSGENCILNNVPRIKYVEEDLDFLQELGVSVSWVGQHKLFLNAAGMTGFDTTRATSLDFSTYLLVVPALIHKFGKAFIPKTKNNKIRERRFEEFATLLVSVGLDIEESGEGYYIEARKMTASEVSLPSPSRFLTELAIMTCLSITGESLISNTSFDNEIDDLITFCVEMGAQVERLDDGRISVMGVGVLKSVSYELPFDRDEAVFFATCALLTRGNITLSPVERHKLLPFLNWLAKIGGNFEFSSDDLRVWESGSGLVNIPKLKIGPFPDLPTDCQPFSTLIATFAEGDTSIIESPKATNLGFISELNRMGAKISLLESTSEITIEILGGRKLKGDRLIASDPRVIAILWCAALVSSGKSTLSGYELIENYYEDFYSKIQSLGAVLS